MGTSRSLRFERAISAFGVRVGIRTNDEGLVPRLLAVAPPFWRPTPSRSLDRVWSLEMAERRPAGTNGSIHRLWEGSTVVLRSPRLAAVTEDLERRVKAYVAEMSPSRVFVHAGVVGLHGRAILVPGPSMSGKTSLVAALVRAGATYYSDEYAVLDARGRVHPYPAPLGMRRAGSRRQRKLAVEALPGRAGSDPLPVGAVVVTRHQAGSRWNPRALSPGLGLLELLSCTLPARRRPRVVLRTLQKVVPKALIVKGDRGDARRTAAAIITRFTGEWAPARGSRAPDPHPRHRRIRSEQENDR